MTRTLQPGQQCEVRIASVTGERELVFATGDVLLEAPNWTLDGAALVLNGDGKLWTFDVAGRTIRQVPLAGVPDVSPAARRGILQTCRSTSYSFPRITGPRRCTPGHSSAGRGH
jgi:hypothetical protein